MGRLEGKKSIVTGGGRGIGAAIAKAFAREGSDVVVLDRTAADGAETVEAIQQSGGRAFAVGADVSDEQAVGQAIAEAEAWLGQIDILVNNAGIQTVGLIKDMSVQMWDEMIAVNLRSVFLCTRLVLPGMLERRWGRIINTASQLAHKGAAERGHYVAAKAGVVGFTKSLAWEVGRSGITVNAICPGPIDTDITRTMSQDLLQAKIDELIIGRLGTVDEIAPTAVMLASDEGAYYLGVTLNPNGGDYLI
ncbi:SDR family oxidoreductase [Acidisoma cellulosilytica]|uniref:SDR family oxidoreductase n=1 Tax=Acidisoma cellulosilyticum TaxID=2802395 RepID=A0A963Z637_9PROT|nr:SDR family NAD(P)-dependent oxidoreductase [Acidisoma cellulosilyticum]MCB8883181.1 SDR family oxidoreductase [Acidisoma cellulosilyticum]